MAFSIRKLFANLFISVVVESNEWKIFLRIVKNGKIIKQTQASFDQKDAKIKAIEYIKRQEKNATYMYIGLFFDALAQGGLPCVKKKDFYLHNINLSKVKIIYMPEKWSIYANLVEMKMAKSSLGNIGIDLLYSPFSLLYSELKKRTFPKKTTMYIYNHVASICVCVFKGYQMKFGAFFKIDDYSDNTISQMSMQEDENIIGDLGESEQNDEFQTLKPLESIDDLDFKDIDEINNDVSVEHSVSIFGRDMKIYKYIASAIDEFYKNKIYDSSFIEKIIFFDNANISKTFLSYLENEIFVEIECYPVNTLEIINNIMIKEINL